MGYDVELEPMAEFEVELRGAWYRVRHVFAEITEADVLKFRRESMKFKTRRGQVENEGSADLAAKHLYDRRALRAEGYARAGADLMTLPDWKKYIPLPHKIAAVNQLFKMDETEAAGEDPLAESSNANSSAGSE